MFGELISGMISNNIGSFINVILFYRTFDLKIVYFVSSSNWEREICIKTEGIIEIELAVACFIVNNEEAS